MQQADPTPSAPRTDSADAPAAASRGLGGAVLDLFSSVRFGIVLLVLLFVYSTIGSAGVLYPEGWNIFSADNWAHDQLRQWRPFEMTEFEWFNWWPFSTLMLLIAANVIVTTLRRIPFKPVNYGVWAIHTGIVVLIVGSFVYFGSKVEGDTPVARRVVVAEFDATQPDGSTKRERVQFLASPGQRVESGSGALRTSFAVTQVDPAWELLTGDDKGKRVYSVTVMVERNGKRFMRQLLAGKPELTEDLIFTNDQKQPVKRAIKEIGKPIFDDTLALSLDYAPQEWFYLRNDLVKSWALYVRPLGETKWTERPIRGLPLYNDRIGSRDDVYQQPGDAVLALDPIDVAVGPAAADDPFADVTFRVSGYLRYAMERTKIVDGGPSAPLNPVVFLEVADGRGQKASYRLVARDPERSRADAGALRFVSLAGEGEIERFKRQPSLTVRVPAKNIEIHEDIRDVASSNPDAPFVEIKGSEIDLGGGKLSAPYAYRVIGVRDDVPLRDQFLALATVEVRTPKGVFRRWVFDDASLTRDVVKADASDAHGAPSIADPSIELAFEPGNGLALVVLAHGPEAGRLRMVSTIAGAAQVKELKPREATELAAGVTVRVDELFERAATESKPLVIPRAERQRDAMETFAQIKLDVPGATAGSASQWIPFNRWVFDAQEDALRRTPYEPRVVTLADGRKVEVMFSRQRLPLGTAVALEEFVLTSHIGGFTGSQGSIRDYMSAVRFKGVHAAAWSEPQRVSVNEPVEHDGLWYFQAQWDPPDMRQAEDGTASAGLNYTVLGVGNRVGVHVQLAGCCIAVLGMIYAFYVKPVIKRRRQDEVLAGLGRGRDGGRQVQP